MVITQVACRSRPGLARYLFRLWQPRRWPFRRLSARAPERVLDELTAEEDLFEVTVTGLLRGTRTSAIGSVRVSSENRFRSVWRTAVGGQRMYGCQGTSGDIFSAL